MDSPNRHTTPAVRLRGLERRLGNVPVLRGVDLAIARGEAVALFGANGAGKSTLLRTLAGLLRPDAGEALVLGQRLPAGSALRRRVGYLGHDSFLYRDLDARENLGFHGRLFGVHDPARVEQWIARVGLARVATRRVATFSRGMLQRLALARALLHRPELLLLDEPTTGLDAEGTAMFADLLREQIAGGTTVLAAMHDIPQALSFATRALVLRRGLLDWDSAANAPLDAATLAARLGAAQAAA